MFVKDLCIPPSTRGASDISHAVAAVGSRSLKKAQDFIQSNCPNGAAAQSDGTVQWAPKAYGSYKEVVNDPVSQAGPPESILMGEGQHRLCWNDEHCSFRRYSIGSTSWEACPLGKGEILDGISLISASDTKCR